ncbi:hypothetical protein NVS89_22665 [Ancylobacter sp. MQZ15Z-1]|uniref:Uncharacterized protein n=1 Tax=Ancylobacter mangrovi TaxID=2972472 RepID=A0A9X2PKC9_9HYPH|nr:hypothetical protein [Ancylobacter mangrovi]MCS0497898.1 hypothetical protein [Ancylobacter mangrovi]
MCDCIATTTELLKPHNAGVTFNLIGPARACVDLYKLDPKKRGRPPILQATFCPFCGERYADSTSSAGERIPDAPSLKTDGVALS